jgi:predicted dinucleotide-binding enzyme
MENVVVVIGAGQIGQAMHAALASASTSCSPTERGEREHGSRGHGQRRLR